MADSNFAKNTQDTCTLHFGKNIAKRKNDTNNHNQVNHKQKKLFNNSINESKKSTIVLHEEDDTSFSVGKRKKRII